MTFKYEIIVGKDRAYADDLGGALVAAATLVRDFTELYGGSGTKLRKEIIIMKDDTYDGFATNRAREGVTI